MKFAIITMGQRRLRDTLDEIEKQTCKKMKTSSVGCGEQIQFIKKRRKKKKEIRNKDFVEISMSVLILLMSWYNLVTMSGSKRSLDLRRLNEASNLFSYRRIQSNSLVKAIEYELFYTHIVKIRSNMYVAVDKCTSSTFKFSPRIPAYPLSH